MKRFILGLAVMGLLLVPFNSYGYDDGDWQYWNTEKISGKIIDVGTENLDSVDAGIEGEFRWGDDISEFYYQHADVGIKLKKLFAKWFSFGIAYRQVWEYKHRTAADGGNHWIDENRPHFNPEVNFKICDWKIKNRFRVELRYFDEDISGKDDTWRLRNKLSVKPPIKWTEWGITPYAADEIFYGEDDDGISRNRLYVGLGIGHLFNLEHVKGDIYYLWQYSDKGDDWETVNAIGTKLKVVF